MICGMTILEALILGIVQGVTEFLPISSSGHLVLGEELLGLEVANLKAFDVVVHLGSLLAILGYFWRDVWGMILALIGRSKDSEYGILIKMIILGTVPAVIVGLFFEDVIDGWFRNVLAVGVWMTIIGGYFCFAEWRTKGKKRSEMNLGKSFVVGLAQSLALVPGVSRSGSTIATGILLGVDRAKAARFSFLLGIPAIAGAGLLTGLKVLDGGGLGVGGGALVVGFFSSFVFGLLSVWWLMRFLKKRSLLVFAAYLLVVGGVAIWSSGIF